MGDNAFGQLGLGVNYNQTERMQKIEGIPYTNMMTVGSNHVYAITKDKVYGWGNNQQN
jgi:alpha-tubulin suppressor-like RCC1 family protein